jgi:hypothetical protein
VRSVEMTESDQERRRQIRERLAKATPGAWHWTDCGDGRFMIGPAGSDGRMYHVDAIAYVLRSRPQGEVLLTDLDLISHTPADLTWLEEQLTQAEARLAEINAHAQAVLAGDGLSDLDRILVEKITALAAKEDR